jgi:ATP-binding cassette subfamily B protein
MSEDKPAQLKETERIQAGPGPGRGPFGGGMVGQKANNFKPSAKRLVRRMAPEKNKAIGVIALAVLSVGLMSLGPRILGRATDIIFAGVLGRQLQGKVPDGTSQQQVVAGLRQQGDDKQASMIASMKDFVVGRGVDFTSVAHVLELVLAVYVAASSGGSGGGSASSSTDSSSTSSPFRIARSSATFPVLRVPRRSFRVTRARGAGLRGADRCL